MRNHLCECRFHEKYNTNIQRRIENIFCHEDWWTETIDQSISCMIPTNITKNVPYKTIHNVYVQYLLIDDFDVPISKFLTNDNIVSINNNKRYVTIKIKDNSNPRQRINH